jgi:hypothetical protein
MAKKSSAAKAGEHGVDRQFDESLTIDPGKIRFRDQQRGDPVLRGPERLTRRLDIQVAKEAGFDAGANAVSEAIEGAASGGKGRGVRFFVRRLPPIHKDEAVMVRVFETEIDVSETAAAQSGERIIFRAVNPFEPRGEFGEGLFADPIEQL